MTPESRAANHIAMRVWKFLGQHSLAPDIPTAPVFYVYPLRDRALLVFDPAAHRDLDRLLTHKYTTRLSRHLAGRRVVASGDGGIYVQIAYTPTPTAHVLESRPLPLSEQPHPLALPCGTTARGPLWLPLQEADSILVAGSRQMGKTTLLHAWIMALAQGGQAELYLWDGKRGGEFGRYASAERVIYADDIDPLLERLSDQMHVRQQIYRQSGARNYRDHAEITGQQTVALVMIIDEVCELNAHSQEAVEHLLRLGGGYAVHPILGTQHPSANTVRAMIRANLKTRVALPVPTPGESVAILGHGGAEKLAKTPGRMCLDWQGRTIEAQGYVVDPPRAPTALPQATPLISEAEERLARIAVDTLDGWFNILALTEKSCEARDWINALAMRWETQGLLTEVLRDERGHNAGRRVTERLRGLLDNEEALSAAPTPRTPSPRA